MRHTIHMVVIAVLLVFGGCRLTRQQTLDSHVDGWSVYAFSSTDDAVTIRVPRGFRPLTFTRLHPLPEAEYNEHSRRSLLAMDWDYWRENQFEAGACFFWADFVRLKEPYLRSPIEADSLDGALQAVEDPERRQRHLPPQVESTAGREWLHYHNLDITLGEFESFGTLIDRQTLLFIAANYSNEVRRNPDWLASRRKMMLMIRDQIVVMHQ